MQLHLAIMYSTTKTQTELAESEQNLQAQNWRQHLGVLAAILAVYFFLAFYRIEYQSLWLDEIITVITADPNRPLLGKFWFGGRGPLYPISIQLWPKWGSEEFAFRSFSVLIGGITVCLAYLMARRLFTGSVAWISTALFATSPFLIWYSQEARYINLAMMTALLAMYVFHFALSTKRLGSWLLYCVSVIFAVAVFMVNFLLLPVQALCTLCTPSGRANFRKSIVSSVVVVALFVWWANDGHIRGLEGYWLKLYTHMTPTSLTSPSPNLDQSNKLNVGGSRQFNIMELPYTFFVFSSGFSLGPSVRELQISQSLGTLMPHAFTLTILGLLFGGLFIAGMAVLWRQPDLGGFLTFWLAIPIVAAIGFTAVISGLSYNVRYASMAFPPYLFILAAGIGSFQHRGVRVAVLVSVLFINSVSLANYYYNPRYAREDARAAARYLESAAQPQDVILILGSSAPIKYYYKGNLPVIVFNGQGRQTETSQYLRKLQKDYQRLWLVEIRPWEIDPRGHLKEALDSVNRPDRKGFAGVNVYTYDLTKL